jgi:hypothetical protein
LHTFRRIILPPSSEPKNGDSKLGVTRISDYCGKRPWPDTASEVCPLSACVALNICAYPSTFVRVCESLKMTGLYKFSFLSWPIILMKISLKRRCYRKVAYLHTCCPSTYRLMNRDIVHLSGQRRQGKSIANNFRGMLHTYIVIHSGPL